MTIKFDDSWIEAHYHIAEKKNGLTILKSRHPDRWKEIKFVLSNFRLLYSEVASSGGGKSKVTQRLEKLFKKKGWKGVEVEHSSVIRIGKNFNKKNKVVYKRIKGTSETHELDLFKKQVGIEIEWNNKHQFFSRDLELFSYLYEVEAIEVGVIITRHHDLEHLFKRLGVSTVNDKSKGKPIADKYGETTTQTDKLEKLLKTNRFTCPLVVIGITEDIFTYW
ncbi:hypothetical protein A9498_02880 [Bacillus thuringiensis serovar coreanensis]|nr:hypothetical protein A9498_02880 [Bacillus thuringiensis serovar coreanensis]